MSHRPGGADRYARAILTACSAPDTSLYLRPDGYVLACCGSGRPLGRISGPRRRSLREIWDSRELRDTRDALARRDFRFGCDECGELTAQGYEDQTLARSFDHLAEPGPVRSFPRYIDFALSNRCNLECVMCNGDLSSSIRINREGRAPLPDPYDDRFFDELRTFLPHLDEARFKGGEPFLAPAVRRVWQDLAVLAPACKVFVDTNATTLTEAAAEQVAALRMHVSISIDAARKEPFEAIRLGASFDRVMAVIDRHQEIAAGSGGSVDLTFCLMSVNVAELAPFLVEAERRGVEASVIWVNQPRAYDLLRQPRAEIEGALIELERADRTTADQLGPTRPLWEATLARLRAHLAAPRADTSVAVSIGGPPGTEPDAAPPADVDALADELRAGTGHEPLVGRSSQGLWVSVTDPAWASELATHAWIGESIAETMALIWSATGSSAEYEITTRPDGVRDIVLHLDEAAELRDLRAVLTPDHPDQGSVLLIAPTGPPPA